jgi:lysophospholipase L1-like esterase
MIYEDKRMLLCMANSYYGVGGRRQDKARYFLERYHKRQARLVLKRRFCLAIGLFLFLVVLIFLFLPGFSYTIAKIFIPSGYSSQTDPAAIECVEAEADTVAAKKDENDPAKLCSEKKNMDLPVYEEGVYDYSKPVPAAGVAVGEDYFQDAVFIGDSRTEGLRLFGDLQEATYYTAKGLKVDTIFTQAVVKTTGGQKITIMEALRQKPFRKVYIMLGINELGWAYSDLFIKKYGEIINEIRDIEPQAQIYAQSLFPVSKQRSQSDKIYNNANIGKYNELIQQMAAEKKFYYLDVAQCVVDQEGNLAGDASTDGIHLNKTYCNYWVDYLKSHYVLQ